MKNKWPNSEAEKLKAVLKISQVISQTLDLEKILMMSCEMTARILRADRCSIALASTEGIFEIAKSYKRKPSYPSIDGMRFDLKNYPHIAPPLLKGKTVHIPDHKRSSLSVKERAIFKQLSVKSLLGIPILAGRKVIGAVIPSRIEESSSFCASDLSLCKTIANHVGIAITNTKLIKSLREKHKQLNASQEEARLANERLRYLMFSTSAVIYASKTAGDYRATFITDNVRRMTGYKPRQFIHDSNFWISRVHPQDVQRILTELPSILKKGYHSYDYRFRCKNSKYIWVRDEMKLVRDAKGQPLEIIGFWTDITEHKKAEQVLGESEERYRRLFEDSPISLWDEDFSRVKSYIDTLKSSGVRDFRKYFERHPEKVVKSTALVKVVDVNRATLKVYKAKSKDELRRSLNLVFSKESYPVCKEELIAIADGKTTFESDTVNQTLKREPIHINLRWSVAPGHEKALSKVLVSVIDITERKHAENLLKQTAEQLKIEREALERKNIALREVLNQIETEKNTIKQQVVTNVEQAILPTLLKMKQTSHPVQARNFDLLEKELKEIISPFLSTIKNKFAKLSPRELEVSRLIKNGMTSKEIAGTLGVSPLTVHKYRELIRKKLGLVNNDTNLQTYLQSF